MSDRRVTVFIDKAERWQAELKALRAILLDTGLTESFKWRQPVYTSDGKNVAILWAFRDSCGLGFFKGALMKDPEGVMVAPGENSRSARKIPFTSVGEIARQEGLIRAYVAEAVEIQRKGLKVAPPSEDADLPEEVEAFLHDDADLKAAWDALTPGRRRGYAIHFSGAKKAKTRVARLEKHVPRILDGLGLHDRD